MICYMIDIRRERKHNSALRINARAKSFPQYIKPVNVKSPGKFTLDFKDINEMARWFAYSSCSAWANYKGNITFDWDKMVKAYDKQTVFSLTRKINILIKNK